MKRHGSSEVKVEMLWGECRLKVRKWRCGKDRLVVTSYPAGIDGSGLSPEVLKRCLDLTTRLPYREGHDALKLQGIDLGLSRCERLCQRYAQKVVERLEQWVDDAESLPADPYEQPDSYVVQLDGVMVIEQDKPNQGSCERQAQRASWCRGDINASVWFKHHVEDSHSDTSTWSDEALKAFKKGL